MFLLLVAANRSRARILPFLLLATSPSMAQVVPSTSGDEIDAFKKAQGAILKHYKVEAESRYLKLKDPDLTAHVLIAGNGEPMLLMHGGAGFAAQFAPLLGSLQGSFKLYAPDRPGCGLTDKFDYSKTNLRAHAVSFIESTMDALGLKKAILVGSSMGGLWSLQFALARPERVSKLILLGEPAGSPPVMTNAPPPWTGKPPIESVRIALAMRLVADVKKVPQEYIDLTHAARYIPGADVSWNTLLAKFIKDDQRTYQLRPELAKLSPATLFLWGDQDKLGPPSLGEEMARLAPNAKCQIIAHAGHILWFDQLELVTKAILEFVRT